MVAYSFKPGFVPLIRSGEKRQTIRLERKRHARPGEALQLFTGPRMRPIRLGAARCLDAPEIRIDFAGNLVELEGVLSLTADWALNAFAVRDGFRSCADHGLAANRLPPWELMRWWFAMTHPQVDVFAGRLIDWGGTFEAVEIEDAAA